MPRLLGKETSGPATTWLEAFPSAVGVVIKSYQVVGTLASLCVLHDPCHCVPHTSPHSTAPPNSAASLHVNTLGPLAQQGSATMASLSFRTSPLSSSSTCPPRLSILLPPSRPVPSRTESHSGDPRARFRRTSYSVTHHTL
jgi:hypothetical protein